MERFCTHCGSSLEQGIGACPQCGKARSIASRVASNPKFRQATKLAFDSAKSLFSLIVRLMRTIGQDAMSIVKVSTRVVSETSEQSTPVKKSLAVGKSIWIQLTRRERTLLVAAPVVATFFLYFWLFLGNPSSDENASGKSGPHVRAGGYLCNQPINVAANRAFRNQPITYGKCEQIGEKIYVNIIGENQNLDAVWVENGHGKAWVDRQDLVQ